MVTSVFLNFHFHNEKVSSEKSYAKLVDQNELILSGNLRQHFYSSKPNDFISAAKSAKRSVVGINVLQKNNSKGGDKYSKVTGSGVIVSSDGYIVTNFHVIEGASDLAVLLDDNREFKAKIVGTDQATDIAVLKIEAHDVVPILYGNSDSLQIGEWILAIGNPFNLQTTVTAGIVSAKARDINILQRQGIESFIQTDAAINSGNSGGALINTKGELVGINTAIMTKSGRYEGFSFAIPINLVQKVVYDIREFGAVQRGWMGISIFDVDADIAKRLKLDNVDGIYIELVEKGSAAFDAGIRTGDVVTHVNNNKCDRIPEFMEQIAKYRPGDQISIDYIRDEGNYKTSVILRNQLNTTSYIAVRKDPILLNLGFEIRDLDEKELNLLPKKGVYVVSIYKESKISETNMEPGYIITSLNGDPVSSATDLINILKDKKGDVILDGYYANYVGSFPYTFHNN